MTRFTGPLCINAFFATTATFLGLFGQALAGDPQASFVPPLSEQNVASCEPLELSDCIRIALDKQPLMAAARAKVALIEHQSQSLEQARKSCLGLPPDLLVRRQQARLGVLIVRSQLDQRENETVYTVARLFFSVQFARAQLGVAQRLVNYLDALNKRVHEMEKKDTEDLSDTKDLTLVYLRSAQARLEEARRGVALATAALREALGLDPNSCLDIVKRPLRDVKADIARNEIVELALARRPELLQARLAIQMYHLEIEAQRCFCLPGLVRTFAAAGDVHSAPGLEIINNEEYRPGIPPQEMPPFLGGTRAVRVKSAELLESKSAALAEKARQLVALQADDAFLRWREAARKVTLFREGTEAADRLVKAISRPEDAALAKVPAVGPTIVGLVIQTKLLQRIQAASAESHFNEALFHQMVTLADLDRVTAGGLSHGAAGKVWLGE